jgi:hypothetical protein
MGSSDHVNLVDFINNIYFLLGIQGFHYDVDWGHPEVHQFEMILQTQSQTANATVAA